MNFDLKNEKVNKYLAFCGILGPLLFSLVCLILGALHPEYNHISQYISEIGAMEAPYALAMNLFGFILLGLLIIAFSLPLHKTIPKGYFSFLLPLSLLFSGLGFIFTGIFPCDPGCVTVSMIGVLHGNAAFVALYALIFSPLFMYLRVCNQRIFRFEGVFSLMIFFISIVLVTLYKSYIFEDLTGLMQRLSFGVPLLWVEIIAIQMFRKK